MAIPLVLGFFSLLRVFAGPLIARALLSLGIGFVAFTGISALLDQLKSLVVANIQALSSSGTAGPFVLQLLGVLRVDLCINILFSAIAVRMVLAGLNAAGSIRKLRPR